jgi:hypothetical protein
MSEREQPDPGEGWRMLHDGEITQAGDQYKREKDEWIDDPNPTKVFNGKIHWPHRRRIFMSDTLRDLSTPQPDLVNSPPHYRQGDIECIDAIRSALTDEEFRGYVKGNAIKYLWREKHKGGDEDLKKAAWYLSRIETKEATK